MMQVQKGQVKYGDRTDIVVDYGIDDNNNQYYFINGGNLSNGSYIATTKLIEAIPSKEVPANIGVVDKEGNQVIPFDNKNIKSLFDEYLLVEVSKPISESVIANIEARNNPLAISELVSTSSTIKANITKEMNSTGKFYFNDQFSEATIYDYSGTNILNNEYYSYIGCDDTGFYLSKSVLNSRVLKYDFTTKSLTNLSEEKVEEVVPTQLSEETPVDVVTPEEAALEVKAEAASSPEIPVVEDNTLVEVPNDNVQVDVVEDVPVDSSGEVVDNSEAIDEMGPETEQEDKIDVSDVNIDKEELEEKIVEEMEKSDSELAVDNVESETEEIKDDSQETVEENNEQIEDSEKVDSVDNDITAEDTIDNDSEIVEEDTEVVSEDSINNELNIEDLEKEDSEDKELNIEKEKVSDEVNIDMDMRNKFNSEFEQSLDDYSEEQYDVTTHTPVNYEYKNDISDYDFDSSETKSSVLPDAISAMEGLIRQNKELKKELSTMYKKNSNLESKIVNFETAVSKLENKNQILESQNRQLDNEINDKSDVIEQQNRKINSLEDRIKTHKKDEEDLSNLLKTAKGVLRQGDSYDNYDSFERTYRRVA